MPRRTLPTILLLLALLVGPACEAPFEPVVPNDEDFFALHGFLDTRADTQFVRVSPVRSTAAPAVPPLDAAVTLAPLGLGTSQAVVWRDSLVQLADGTSGFLFYSVQPVEPGTAYTLTVERSDGAQTRARVNLPGLLAPEEQPVRSRGDVFDQPVRWPGLVTEPAGAQARYRVQVPGGQPVFITLPIDDLGEDSLDGWELLLPLSADRFEVYRRLGRDPAGAALILCGVGMAVDELSSEWFDATPGQRIEGGYGFFGGVTRHVGGWTLTDDLAETLGYLAPPEGGCAPLPEN